MSSTTRKVEPLELRLALSSERGHSGIGVAPGWGSFK